MIIMLVGEKGVGKTTLSLYLRDVHDFVIYSFAGPLKKAAREIFMLNAKQTDGDLKEVVDERYGVTPRKIMQVIGTELFQYDLFKHIPELKEKIGERKLWTYLFKEYYENLKGSIAKLMKKTIKNNLRFNRFSLSGEVSVDINPNIVIDDGRFVHEAEEIKKMGGIIIRLIRVRGSLERDNHPSEQEFDKINSDYTINVDHSLGKKEAENDLFNILKFLEIFN